MNQENIEKILEAVPWRCFHCDFVTTDRATAAAHFGERDDPEEFKPVCRWWENLSADERVETLQDTLKQLTAERDENTRLRMRIEDLEYQTEGQMHAIHSYKPFREANCRSIYDIFCLYDSMEGRALAAEEANKPAEPPAKWCCKGVKTDNPTEDQHEPHCQYHSSNFKASASPPLSGDPSTKECP